MKHIGIIILVAYLVIINILAFILMAVDKRRARAHQWRIRERTLFLSAIIGGSIGANLGMQLLRHKTKHKSFVYGMPAILLVQILAAAAILIFLH